MWQNIPLNTNPIKTSVCSLSFSLKIAKALEEKAARFDYDFQKKCVEERDYEKLEMYVMELLMGI